MCSTSLIRLWFVCKPCNITLQNLNDFIAHKKEKHLPELLRNKCIVFEESTLEGVAVAETGAAGSDPGYEAVHFLTVKEKTKTTISVDQCIESTPSEQIPNLQLVKSESQSNFNDPNHEPAIAHNVLGLNSTSHFELQDSDLNQNSNDNYSYEDVKLNPDLIITNPETKYQVCNYEIENGEPQSKNIRKKPTQNPYLYLKRLTQQEIRSASSVLVTSDNPKKYRRPRKMCSMCPKSFADQRSLRGHFEQVHKLPLPPKSCRPKHFACKVCGITFTHGYSLRRHIQNKHKTERVELEYRRLPSKFKPNLKVCTICLNSYADIKSLKRHIQLKHAINDDTMANLTAKEL